MGVMKEITGSTTIGEAIVQKGTGAGEILDKTLCNSKGECCPGTTLQIEYAAIKRGKQDKVPTLLKELNKLPDIR
jgi:hypothetical protein